MANQVQYMITPTCNNNCKFCLRDDRGKGWGKENTINRIKNITKNIEVIDWAGKFSDGISLLGGEIFYMTDPEIIQEFMNLVDHCIDVILPQAPKSRIAFVTNGIYDPNVFLYPVLDRITERVGKDKFDIAVSYDIKYRYATEEAKQKAINTINGIHDRYDYQVGIQTILTQYLIRAINEGTFSIKDFEENIVPGNFLCLLYPHPLNSELDPLPDFQFEREEFIDFMLWLKENYPLKFDNFYLSTKNSAIKKETGAIDVGSAQEATMQPMLTSGKEIINVRCNHSVLYQCYADSNRCMLCDLQNIGR